MATYKTLFDRFKTEYRHICQANEIKEIKLDNEEVILYLSKACADFSFNERLVDKLKTVDLVLDQYEYTTGTGASNIPSDLPSDFADILEVKFDEGGTNNFILQRVSIEDMPEGERSSGKPGEWTIYYTNSDRKLILNIKPDQSYTSSNGYRLYVYYTKKLLNYSGTAEDTYSDLDFTSATFGGSFLIPTEWENVAVMKAITNVLPIGLRERFEVKVDIEVTKLANNKPIYINTKLPYKLGVDC